MIYYDVVVLGGGSGGYAAASKLAGYGLKTCLIEKAEKLGGLCILRGCMPSKALIESANFFRRMKNSAEFGIHCDGLRADMGEIQDRKQELISEFQSYREEQLTGGEFELLRGDARFVEKDTVALAEGGGERRIKFGSAVIATGSVPFVPDIEGIYEGEYWVSDDALATREIPEHLVILGAGAIGCELAHCFEGLGGKVSVIQRSGCMLTEFDEEIGKELTEVSRKRGIEVHCGATAKEVRWPDEGGVEVEIETNEGSRVVRGTQLLVATGRKAASNSICPDAAGIETDGDRIVTDEHQRTSVKSIYAIGDVAVKLPVVHAAVLQGEAVARSIAKDAGKTVDFPPDDDDPTSELFGIFTHPECARAGMSKEAIEKSGIETEIAKYRFSEHGKAEIIGETAGFVRIISEKESGRILGASVIGPHAVELIHEMQIAIYAGVTVREFAAIPHYHPTLSEIWTYPAEALS